MYYCYDCRCLVGDTQGIPQLELPLTLQMYVSTVSPSSCVSIKHQGESNSKSTAIQAWYGDGDDDWLMLVF